MKNRTLIEHVSQTGEAASRGPRLTRADWLEKALDVLVGHGVDAVRITRLADLLGVTRGSFYWHFKDRTEVLDAMVEFWDRKNTALILEAASRGPDLEASVLAIFEVWLTPDGFDPRLDFAIRDWARGDERLQAIVREADRKRLDALAAMFARNGFDHAQAETRARNIYYIQMGYYALDVREPMSDRLDLLPTYFETYTGGRLSPQAIAAFRSKVLDSAGR